MLLSGRVYTVGLRYSCISRAYIPSANQGFRRRSGTLARGYRPFSGPVNVDGNLSVKISCRVSIGSPVDLFSKYEKG